MRKKIKKHYVIDGKKRKEVLLPYSLCVSFMKAESVH